MNEGRPRVSDLRRLVRLLPDWSPLPQVTIDEVGNLCIEWHEFRDKHVFIRVIDEINIELYCNVCAVRVNKIREDDKLRELIDISLKLLYQNKPVEVEI